MSISLEEARMLGDILVKFVPIEDVEEAFQLAAEYYPSFDWSVVVWPPEARVDFRTGGKIAASL